jgi:hypothetical protein
MIDWTLELEDVSCPDDDMKMNVRGWAGGRENKGSGYELMGESRIQTAQGCEDTVKTPGDSSGCDGCDAGVT